MKNPQPASDGTVTLGPTRAQDGPTASDGVRQTPGHLGSGATPGPPQNDQVVQRQATALAGLQTGQWTSWGHVMTVGPHLGCARNDAQPRRMPSRLLRVRRTRTTRGLSRTAEQDLSHTCHDYMTAWSCRMAPWAEEQRRFWNSPWGPLGTLWGNREPHPWPPRVLGGIRTPIPQDTSGMQDKLRNRSGAASGSLFLSESQEAP